MSERQLLLWFVDRLPAFNPAWPPDLCQQWIDLKMRQIAAKALELTIARPTGSVISVVGNFGANTEQPYITLTTPNQVNQLPVEQAREIAQNILSEAATAEQDGLLFTFLRDREGLDVRQIAHLIAQLRDYRAQFRPDLNHQPPPDEGPPTPSA